MINITSFFVTKDGTTVNKHGTHDQQSHAGGRGGGAGAGKPAAGAKNMESAVRSMNEAVRQANNIAIQHGDTKMKDAAYSATKEVDNAIVSVESGKHLAAKEYMEVANNTLQGFPEMAEKAGLSGDLVDKLSSLADDGFKSWTKYRTAWQK